MHPHPVSCSLAKSKLGNVLPDHSVGIKRQTLRSIDPKWIKGNQ